MGIRGADEFQLILNDLGLSGEKGAPVQAAFAKVYLHRLDQLNAILEDETAAMTTKVNKTFPLNMQLTDENLSVSNPRIVDIEWQTLYTLASKNLNKLLNYRFLITLTVLC